MNISIVTLLLFLSTSYSQPFLKGITDFISGFKYVPPQTGIFASSPTTKPFEDKKRVDDQSITKIVFSTDGWLQPAGSHYLYKLGENAMTFSEAKYWCTAEGGHIAEIHDEREMEVVQGLLKRDSSANFWIGLKSPRTKWLITKKTVAYSNWEHGEPKNQLNERCTVLRSQGDFGWAAWNCGTKNYHHTPFKALCQKDHTSSSTESILKSQASSEFRNNDQCTVKSFSLRGEDWLGRIDAVTSSDDCHQQCLETESCNFWTWRKDSSICYLRETDGLVTKDELSVSGTTSAARGCHHSLGFRQPRVEYCSCVSVSHQITDGYIDPRALPVEEEGSGANDSQTPLGRLLISSACPSGQVLTCTDEVDPEHNYGNEVEVIEAKSPKSNITDCLVNDVRLSVGGLISKVINVQNAATCHAHCLATEGCAYWTWRGDTQEKKCFLKPNEGRTIRRHGAASGTVLRSLGCDKKIIHYLPEVPESREEPDCYCEKEYTEDLVSEGLINPRTLPLEDREYKSSAQSLGRIVTSGIKKKACREGYKKVCKFQQTNGPKLFNSGLPKFQGIVRERALSNQKQTKEVDASSISFPEVK